MRYNPDLLFTRNSLSSYLESIKNQVRDEIQKLEESYILNIDEESFIQYPNGKYQLKNGLIVNADSFNYEASDVFDYATVIFYEGKLVHLQVDTELSVDDSEKRLGISFHNATVEPYKFGSGYEFIFNEIFADENIAMFPNEWD